jgi:hypothetical protein
MKQKEIIEEMRNGKILLERYQRRSGKTYRDRMLASNEDSFIGELIHGLSWRGLMRHKSIFKYKTLINGQPQPIDETVICPSGDYVIDFFYKIRSEDAEMCAAISMRSLEAILNRPKP